MAKELALGIVIGATLRSGFGTVFGRAERTAKALGREIEGATKANEAFGRSLRAQASLGWTDKLRQGSRAYADMAVQIKNANRAQNNLNQAMALQASVQEQRRRFGSEFMEAGKGAAVVAAPVFGAVRKFMEQETAATGLKVAMMRRDGSFGRFEEIDRLTTEWGTALPGNKTDFTQMALGLKSQGISDDTIINGGGLATAQLNTVMGIPIADGSFFAKNMEAHGIKERDLLASADLTQRAYFAAGLTKEDMYQAMSYYAPKANSLNLTGLENQKQIYAIEGLAANKGLEGSSFGTNFSMMLSQLSRGPKMIEEAARGMKSEVRHMMESSGAKFEFFNPDGTMKSLRDVTGILESEFGKIRARFGDQGVIDVADAIFGQEGGRVASILGQAGLSGFDGMMAKMDQQASLEERIRVKTNNLSSAMESLGGVAENAAASFGEVFAPEIKAAAIWLQGFLDNTVLPFIKNNSGLIKTVVGAAAAFFGLKMVLLGAGYVLTSFAAPILAVYTGFRKLQAARALFALLQLRGASRGVALLRSFGFSAQWAGRITGFLSRAVGMLAAPFARIGMGAGVFGKLAAALGLAKHALFALGRALLMTPIGWIALAIAAAAVLIYKYWRPIKAFFIGAAEGIRQGVEPLKPVFAGLSNALSGIWATIQPFVQPILSWFADFFSVTQAAEGGARSFGESVGLWIGEKITAVVNWVVGKIEEVKFAFSGGLTGILALIVNWSPIGAFYSAFAAVLSWFGIELPAKFTGFGQMILDGLINGIRSRVAAVLATVRGVAANMKSAFTNPVEIRSPSRVFARYGGWLMEGLQGGIGRGRGGVLSAVGSVASHLQQRFTSRSAPLSAELAASMQANSAEFAAARQAQVAGGITVHFNPTIHAPGGEVSQIQSALQMGLREFEDLFNRLMAERARRAY